MISPLQATLRAAITDTVTRLYGLDAASLPAIAVEVPPRRALGDLAVPLAFELARRLRKAPRVIAQEIVAALGPLEGISKAEAAPNGYINVFFDRAGFVRRGSGRRRRTRRRGGGLRHPARQHDRRAHRDQSEQGGPHRSPAQFGARRHVRPPAPLLRRAGRSPELHRRHRRAGRRRGGGLPGAGGQVARRDPRRSPTRRASTTTAGTSTRGSPSGTRATRNASRSAPRRSTTSSTAATHPPRSPPSSPTASSTRT